MATLLQDDFSEANGTSMSGKALDVGGVNWSVLVGSWDVQSGQARLVSGAGDNQNSVVANVGQADGYTEVDIVTAASGRIDFGVIANGSNATNYWLFAWNPIGRRLYQRVSGTFTTRASDSDAPSNGTTYRYRIVTNGDTITVYEQSGASWTQVLTYTVASRPLKTATLSGIRIWSGTLPDNGSQFDNFLVTDDGTEGGGGGASIPVFMNHYRNMGIV